jgi:hypothetical protein
METKKVAKKSYSFKSVFTSFIIFLLIFLMVRSCFSSDEPTRVYTLSKVSGKLVSANYLIDLNLLDSNENIISSKNKNLYKGYSARIIMFENDDWYSLKYDFNELDGENLECCILDTTIKLGQQKFNKNTLKLNIPKKGSITIASQVFVAYQLIDPKGKIIGSGNVDYDDFQFTVEQEKSSDYDITLYKKAIVVSDGELSRAFLDNEISADEKYKGKLIEVTGRIDDLGKSKYGDIQYILHGSSGGGGIQCVLAEINNKEHKEKYVNLKNGQVVTIRGYVQGLIGGVTDLEKALGKTKGDNIFLEKCIVK